MHLILLAIIAILLVIVIRQSMASRDKNLKSLNKPNKLNELASEDSSASREFNDQLAFVANGKLFYRDSVGSVQEIHSEFILTARDRMEKRRQLHGWKEGTSFNQSYSGGGTSGISEVDIHVVAAQFLEPDVICYFLMGKNVGGLFEYNIESRTEKRLLHQQNLDLRDFSFDKNAGLIWCTTGAAGGISNIASVARDGSGFTQYTEGDTIDSFPAPVFGQPGQIVMQSSGIGRNTDGHMAAIGPTSLQLLNTGTQEMTTVCEHESFDYLQPRVHPDGNLYYIRRPYDSYQPTFLESLLDAIYFPFRMLRAIFHYLNFFSLMYTSKPLTSASGPKVEADYKNLVINGKRIDAEKALRKENRIRGIPSLVPASWQLIQRDTHGVERVVAQNVLSFDISGRGSLVYTNGCGVFHCDENGIDVLAKESRVELLLADRN